MARRVLGGCAAALVLHLACVAAVQRLNNINDLKRIPLGQSVPRHSLKLLHWFANQVDMSDNGIRLNFNPNTDFGSHHYGNFENMLPQVSTGYRYYTVGNLNEEGAEELPDYVRHQQHDNSGNNLVRIIFRVHGQVIDQVYLTQHYGNSQDSAYDPAHTYKISKDLLRELRQLSEGGLVQLHTSRGQSRVNLSLPSTSVEIDRPAVRQRQRTNFRSRVIICVGIIIVIAIIILVTTLSLKKKPL